jgi:hypothetical protein
MEEVHSPALRYKELKELAEQLGLPVREEATEVMRGGLFTLKGKQQIFVNRADTFSDRIDLLVSVLRKRDIGDIFIKPAIRELLEKNEK